MALVDSLKQNYSFSALKQIDWDQLSGRYRQAAESADNIEVFVAVISKMLAELQDLHVWIESPDGGPFTRMCSAYRANFDYQAVMAKLIAEQRFGRLGFTGRTAEGFGVVVIDGLPAEDDERTHDLMDATMQNIRRTRIHRGPAIKRRWIGDLVRHRSRGCSPTRPTCTPDPKSVLDRAR